MYKRIPIIIGLIIVFLASSLFIAPLPYLHTLIGRLQNLGYDLQLQTKLLTSKKQLKESNIAIIDIDNKSLAAEGRWLWPRSKFSELINELKNQNVAVIAFDMFFSEPEMNIATVFMNKLSQQKLLNPILSTNIDKVKPLFDGDTNFAKSLKETETVLGVSFLPESQTQNILSDPVLILTPRQNRELTIVRANGYISNIPILEQAAKKVGFINVSADEDGIVRRSPLITVYKDGVYASLALQAVSVFLNEDVKIVTHLYNDIETLEGIKIGSTFITTDKYGRVLIPFVGKSYTFPYYSATDVMHKRIPTDALLGKIVFIGTSAVGLGDLQPAAIENPFPGVEMQATLAHGLIKNTFLYEPAWTFGANLFLIIFFGLVATFLFPYLGPRILSLLVILIPMISLIIDNWLWSKTGLMLSVMLPIIVVVLIAILNLIYGYLVESRRREQLQEIFSHYVPEKFISDMMKTKGEYGLRGEDRIMSVMFCDIRNFTTLSEDLSAEEIVNMLNLFFTEMTEIIFTYKGTVDKYVGDLVMAFWSAPIEDELHAYHALQASIEMQKKAKSMRAELEALNLPELRIGIGINSGLMRLGNMGSTFRRNYTVIGNSVNLAARVESLTKYYGVDIIVSEVTCYNQTDFTVRKLDRVRVKGKNIPTEIYEVICKASEATPDLLEELQLYNKGLDYYFERKWDESLNIMQTLNERYPEKRIYQIYVDRITDVKVNGIAVDWDGVYTHVTK